MRSGPVIALVFVTCSLTVIHPALAVDVAGEVSSETISISNIDEFVIVRGSVNSAEPLKSEAFIRLRGGASGGLCSYKEFVVERRYGASTAGFEYPHTEIVLRPYSPAPISFWTGGCQASLTNYSFDTVIRVTPGGWGKDQIEMSVPYLFHIAAEFPRVFVVRLHLKDGWSVRPFEEASNHSLERTRRRLAHQRAVAALGAPLNSGR
jgi:hypothetical protein